MANPINTVTTYLRSSWAELKKVSWPTRDMTIRYSTIVVVASLAMAVLFATLDLGFSKLVTVVVTAAAGDRAAVPAQTEQPVVPNVEATPEGGAGTGGFEVAPADNTPTDLNATPELPTGNNESPINLPPVQ